MENKIVQNYGNKINANEEEKSQNNYNQYENAYYYLTNQNNKNVVENPKVIQNKIITQNNEVNSSYQQNKKILSINNQNNNSFEAQNEELLINKQMPIKDLQINSNYQTDKKQLNQDFSISNQKISAQRFQISSNNQINCIQQPFEDIPFSSRKPSQSFELNLNDINKYNSSNKKISNIVNIDNQSSAIELCFIAKKPKKKYKISSICQVGVNQTPIVLSFLAQKPKQNINISSTNESSVQNLSFFSSKQIDPNDISSFSKNDTFLSVPKQKNNLKIMTHNQIKNDNEKSNVKSKPKPVLQIVSKNKNKFNKKLKQDLLSQSQISEFYIENNNNKNKDSNNEIIKNNYLFFSKGINEIPNNNINQDLSFISNIKETENLFEINGININDYKINVNNSGNISPPKDKNTFSGNVLSSSQKSANNNRNNIYNNYIMINYQFWYLSSIQIEDEDKDKNYKKTGLNKYNCSFPKKKIKTEYYDIQPVSFQCISSNYLEEEINIVKINEYKNYEIEHVNKIHFYPFKMFRIVEIEYIVDKNEKKEEEKEEDKEEQETKDEREVEEEIIEVKQEEKQEEKKEEKDEKKAEKEKENEYEQEKQQNEDKSEIVYNNDNGKKRRKKRRKK